MPSPLDMRIVKNNDVLVQITVLDKFGNPMNITDFRIRWQVKKSAKSRPVIIKDSTLNGSIAIVNGDAGVFVIQIDAEDTEHLQPGSYFHECTVTDTIGKTVTLTDMGLGVGVFYLREQYARQD